MMPSILNTNPIFYVSNATGVPKIPKMTNNDPSMSKKRLVYQLV